MTSRGGAAVVSAARGLRTGHRPALDGVRAVAIAMVLVDHIGHEPQWHVGHYGVTLFFALSGYLITGLLFDELAQDGTVSLPRFYLRRAARLLPALVVVVVVCDVLFYLLGDIEAVKASIPALAYVANYAVVVAAEYPPGWAHAWSLAVEEHFYAVWPLALIVMLRRLGTRRALGWTLAACVAALAWRGVVLTLDGWDGRWFLVNHGTLARADALLYGCAVALAVRVGWRPRAWMAAAAPAVVVALVVLDVPDVVEATAGQLVLSVACAVLLACLDYTSPSLARVLSWRPLVWLGAISYGLYLWHYPLLYVAYDLGYQGTLARFVSGGLLATAAAAASFAWVEQPLRRAARARESVVVARLRRRPLRNA